MSENNGWLPIETAPTLKTIWVASAGRDYGNAAMEPVYRTTRVSPWKNTYTLAVIDWEPTHWQPIHLPPPPETHTEAQP